MPGSAAVLRIVAGQYNETAAAGALQLCGVRDKLIADAERIVRGQHGVFQRVERAADADAGQPTFHREKGEILPVPALQNKLAARHKIPQLAALVDQQDVYAVFGKIQSGGKVGQRVLQPCSAQSASRVISS